MKEVLYESPYENDEKSSVEEPFRLVESITVTDTVTLDKNGVKKKHQFHRALVKSVRRLTYPEVEDAIQSNHADRKVFDYDYKVTIFNDNTIDHLKLAADFFLENLLKS